MLPLERRFCCSVGNDGQGWAGGPHSSGDCYGGAKLGRWKQKDWDRVMRYVGVQATGPGTHRIVD